MKADVRICECGGDMFPCNQYLFHRIEFAYTCTTCGLYLPIKILTRTRTKYAFITDYIRLEPLPRWKDGDRRQETAGRFSVSGARSANERRVA